MKHPDSIETSYTITPPPEGILEEEAENERLLALYNEAFYHALSGKPEIVVDPSYYNKESRDIIYEAYAQVALATSTEVIKPQIIHEAFSDAPTVISLEDQVAFRTILRDGLKDLHKEVTERGGPPDWLKPPTPVEALAKTAAHFSLSLSDLPRQ
jgi:hypothetical protein